MEQKKVKTKALKTKLYFMHLNLDIIEVQRFRVQGYLCELCALSEAGGEKILIKRQGISCLL